MKLTKQPSSCVSREGAADYRYFPEPDLPLFEISDEWIEEMRTELPEFPKNAVRATYLILACQTTMLAS